MMSVEEWIIDCNIRTITHFIVQNNLPKEIEKHSRRLLSDLKRIDEYTDEYSKTTYIVPISVVEDINNHKYPGFRCRIYNVEGIYVLHIINSIMFTEYVILTLKPKNSAEEFLKHDSEIYDKYQQFLE